jgi:hypothetical protein
MVSEHRRLAQEAEMLLPSSTMPSVNLRIRLFPASAALLAAVLLPSCAESSVDDTTDSVAAVPEASDGGAAPTLPAFDAGSYVPFTPDAGTATQTTPRPDAGAGTPPDAGGAPDAGSGVSVADGAVAASADAGSPTSECVPGTYRGAFSGQVQLLAALFGSLFSSNITGTISIQVATDNTGDLMTIKDGSITGTDQDGNPLSATVSGVFDCKAKSLRDGTLGDGKYVRDGTTNTFSGTVTANYAPNPPSASGSWQVAGEQFQSGSGSWSAVLIP